MNYKSKESGREYSLENVEGTDFYADRDGDLYLVESSGYCYPIPAVEAVKALLKRKNQQAVVNIVCHEKGLETNPGVFKTFPSPAYEWFKKNNP